MDLRIRDEDLISLVGELSADGLVDLQVPPSATSFSGYMSGFRSSGWLYSLLGLALAETLLVEYGSEDGFLVFSRLILGLLLLGLIPGYSTVKLIFPAVAFTLLERSILSIFFSILISILTGILLGSLGTFQATSTALVLTVFTFVITIVAGYRTFRAQVRPVDSSTA